MKDKKKKETDSTDELNTFLESFKEQNPNYTEEELEGAKKIFQFLNSNINNKHPYRTLLLKMLNSLLVYFIVAITMVGFMNKAIIVEPFWLVFPICLGFSFYMLLFRFALNSLAKYVNSYFFLIAIGLAFNMAFFSILNSLAYPLFSSNAALFGFLFFGELFYQLYRFILVRKTLRNLVS